ncbi:hypothetical protein ES705_40557 [subsurface metagenome]
MKSPITGKEMKFLREKKKLIFRKEELEIDFHCYICEESGEKYETEEFSILNLTQVHNKYRGINNLPFPDEIKYIREKYGLSSSKMSEILGLGINTFRSYEHGEIPNTSNGRLIQLSGDPKELKKLINLAPSLSKIELEKLNRKIDLIIRESNASSNCFEEALLDTGAPNEFNGYRRINLTKLFNVIILFSEKLQPWKTVLNKLLFYTDFYHFKKHCFSMTGLNYRAIPLGPVPNNFDLLLSFATNNEFVDIEYQFFNNGTFGEKFIPRTDMSFNSELHNPGELNTLDYIIDRFSKVSTSKIIEVSHQEKGWIENQEKRSLINYFYGFDLSGIIQ